MKHLKCPVCKQKFGSNPNCSLCPHTEVYKAYELKKLTSVAEMLRVRLSGGSNGSTP